MNLPILQNLDLAQAILRVVEKWTGRPVVGTEVYALRGNFLQVTIELQDDEALRVTVADPDDAGAAE